MNWIGALEGSIGSEKIAMIAVVEKTEDSVVNGELLRIYGDFRTELFREERSSKECP